MSQTRMKLRESLKRLWSNPAGRGLLGLVLGALISQVLFEVFGSGERSWQFVGVTGALLLVLVLAGLIWPPKSPPAPEAAPPKDESRIR